MRSTLTALSVAIIGTTLTIAPPAAEAQIAIPLQLHFDTLADPYALDYEYTESMLSIQELGAAVVPEVAKRIPGADTETQLRLIEILARFGPVAAPAAGDLGALLQHDNTFVRAAAVRAIGRIGTPAARMQTELIRLLDDKDPITQGQAAIALLRVDPTYFVFRLNELVIAQGLDEGGVARTRLYLFLRHISKQAGDTPSAELVQLWRIAHYNGLLDSNVAYLLKTAPTAKQPAGNVPPPAAEPTPPAAEPQPAPQPAPQPKPNDSFENLFGQ